MVVVKYLNEANLKDLKKNLFYLKTLVCITIALEIIKSAWH